MFGIEFLPQEINEDTERLIAMLEGGRENLGQEVDFVLIPTNPRNKASVSSLLGAYVLRERFSTMNVESRLKYMPQFVPTISGAGLDKMQIVSQILGVKYGAYVLRERFSTMNVESRLKYMPQFVPTISGAGLDKMQIVSQILGVKYGEFKSVALIGGESGGLDGASLIALASEILGEVSLISGSVVEIWEKDAEQKLVKKLQAGVSRIITQPIFEVESARKCVEHFWLLQERCGTNAKDAEQKLVKKLQAGVSRIITQPIFEVESARKCVEHFWLLQERCGTNAKLLLGVFGIFSAESAYRINEARLGFKIPHTYLDALEQGKAKEGFESLWQDMQGLAREYDVSLYLSTPKHNDLRAYGNELC